MMSGGACCAENNRGNPDPDGDRRGRICIWERTEAISGENAVFPIRDEPDQRGDRIYACAAAGDILGGGQEGKGALCAMDY